MSTFFYFSYCCEKLPSRKVPIQEHELLHDQRTDRKMGISTIGIVAAKVLRLKSIRKAKEKARHSKVTKIIERTVPLFSESISSSSTIDVKV